MVGLRMFQIRKLTVFLAIFSFGLISLCVIFRNTVINDVDRVTRLKLIDELIKNNASSSSCKQPNLPVNSPEILKFIHNVPKVDCSAAGEDWVKCVGHVCTVQEMIKIRHGPLMCTFTDILRLDDFKLTNGKSTITDSYTLKESDVVRVECSSSSKKWSATLTGIRLRDDVWDRPNWNLPHNALKMDVLMFGFDSLSRNAFIRKLPKSYEYLTKVLDGIVLQGYNIVGDGTPQALIPILTGKTELELPDTRKRLKNTKFVNSYPFIWNDFKNAGYVTAFFEDLPNAGTFTYRLNGFKETPTDHYMRPYYLASLKEQNKWPKLCTGQIPRHKVMLNAIKDFFNVYKMRPKFLFGFHGELSHDDYNLIGVADDDLLEFLRELKESGALNNTILIIMADHGHRFADVRDTIQGKQEERLPFFSFTFPQWFREKHGKIYANMQSNQGRLTTPFDIYATLKDVLGPENTGMADIRQRSVSLFSQIPAGRSCAHAYIEPHWCACLEWQKVRPSEPIVERLARTLAETLNDFTEPYRAACEELSIAQIHWAMKVSPNQNLLSFHKNADIDGFVADMSAHMKLERETYQIKVMFGPGNSLFEASISHNLLTDQMELKMSDISRINMYGRQARCVEKNLPQLRKYCYCKNDKELGGPQSLRRNYVD